MSTERIHQLLGRNRYKLATDEDFTYTIDLNSKTKLGRPSEELSVINLNDVFFEERNSSTCYRLLGDIKIMCSNILSGTTGQPTNEDWIIEENNDNNWMIHTTYPKSMNKSQLINTESLSSPAFMGIQIKTIESTTIGSDREVCLVKTNQRHNLVIGSYIYITTKSGVNYQKLHKVLRVDDEYTFILDTDFNGDMVGNFVRVVSPSTKDINRSNLGNINTVYPSDSNGNGGSTTATTFFTTTHDLKIGDYVEIITGTNNNQLNGIHLVLSTPSQTQFVLDVESTLTTTTQVNYKYRFNNGVPSMYFIREFHILNDNYDSHKAAFSTLPYNSNFFNDSYVDDVFMFENVGDIDIKNITDFINRPISELYIMFIKGGSESKIFTENNTTLFYNRENPNNHKIETISIDNDYRSIGDKYIGDFYEYNRLSLEEFVCDDIISYFKPKGGDEFYYYKPAHKVTLKKFSNTVNEVEPNQNITNTPEYAESFNNGITVWRELLPISVFEEGNNGVDYPYNNKCHYIFNNYNLYIRRQNPRDIIIESEVSKDINIVC